MFRKAATDYDVVSVELATAAVTSLIVTQRSELMSAWASKDPALVYVTDCNGALEIWWILHDDSRAKLISPDGKSLTYSTVKSTSNLWLMAGLDAVTPP